MQPQLELLGGPKALPSPFVVLESAGLSAEQWRAFLERVNRSGELLFSIRNTGTKAARDVVVDLELSLCDDLSLNRFRRPSSHLDMFMPDVPGWKTNASNHVHVDNCEYTGGLGIVRQRLKNIAPGMTEKLVPFWVMASQANERGWAVQCSYVIAHSEGVAAKGEFTMRSKYSAKQTLDRQALMNMFS